MAIVKGKYLVVKGVAGTTNYTAYATSHTLSISAETAETAYKGDGAGLWTKAEVNKKSWEATTENLYTDDLTSGQFLKIGDTVHVTLSYEPYKLNEAGTAEEIDTENKADLLFGEAIITSIQINANVGDNATYSVTFTGNSALTGTKPSGWA